MKKTKKGFTLIELLVVVLIIGILAAIAVPQYQKAVMKSQLHRGVSLVESLYQAQQAYKLAHGDFASDIDDLDISLPLNDSCIKTQENFATSFYTCDYGKIGFWNGISNVQYQDPSYQIGYLHYLKELDGSSSFNNYIFQKDKRYCYGRTANKTAQEACLSMGGVYVGEATYTGGWKLYLLD